MRRSAGLSDTGRRAARAANSHLSAGDSALLWVELGQ